MFTPLYRLWTAAVRPNRPPRFRPAVEVLETRALPSLTMTKVVANFLDRDGSGGLSAGDNITYQVQITNNGPLTQRDVTFADLEADHPGTELVPRSVVTSRGLVDVGNGDLDKGVVVDVGDLPAGSSGTIVFMVRVLPGAGATVSNQAHVSSDETPAGVPSDDPATAVAGDATRFPSAGPPPPIQAPSTTQPVGNNDALVDKASQLQQHQARIIRLFRALVGRKPNRKELEALEALNNPRKLRNAILAGAAFFQERCHGNNLQFMNALLDGLPNPVDPLDPRTPQHVRDLKEEIALVLAIKLDARAGDSSRRFRDAREGDGPERVFQLVAAELNEGRLKRIDVARLVNGAIYHFFERRPSGGR